MMSSEADRAARRRAGRLFELTGLVDALEIHSTRDEALASLASAPQR